MPIIIGAGISYSPLLYRKRSDWGAVSEFLRKGAVQPESAGSEDSAVLDDFEDRVFRGFSAIEQLIAKSELDALIVLTADRGDLFDDSNVPQLHMQVGGEVWGDTAIEALGEPSAIQRFSCHAELADILIEQLVRDGFDLAESRGDFRPVGNPERGVGGQEVEAVARLANTLPLIPIHINCHVEPVIPGARIHAFGRALSQAAELTDQRLGILVSGGLSGAPGGDMAGWIDDVLDNWVLARLTQGRSAEIAGIWRARSRTLLGSSAEIRLWAAAGAALESTGRRAEIIDYMPFHHAATGVATVIWR
ncbi:DODA-type extradiol aromatic ring-opening family dioxygenase [Kineobactrum salinum]|uniref:Extradiol ring-cleavage dioxygenase class III enzyme subunit B domain-containing protein n=1 Tax=Kineobactrum salinum TaxID=2708301 RepID=A0A6C0U649_9GAMM|nr:hypothetical protein [Kineobactrum salinum]QIB64914.1 hypothetical protein G3T16_05425 [Kineobactrum salinum]